MTSDRLKVCFKVNISIVTVMTKHTINNFIFIIEFYNTCKIFYGFPIEYYTTTNQSLQ